ncbi:MAG: GNAT family N-acetyltransferase [Candidatus Brocadiia bacterium]
MKITRFAQTSQFLASAGPWLEQDEQVNSLMLGVCTRLAEAGGNLISRPFLCLLEDEGPLVAAVMTPPANVVLYSRAEPSSEALRMIADELTDSGMPVHGVIAPSSLSKAFADTFTAATGRPNCIKMMLRQYVLTEVTPPKWCNGEMRKAQTEDLPLVQEWIREFQKDSGVGPGPTPPAEVAGRLIKGSKIRIWEDGEPVAMSAEVRRSRRGVTIALVYTPKQFRRRGYASSIVARLSDSLLQDGAAFVTLFADLANPTTNRIYPAVGYRPIADFMEFTFE